MFETGIRQLRMAMSMVWGRPINPRNIERLIEDVQKTLDEFGAPGDDVQQLLDGPFSDAQARREFQNRALQLTARRLARTTAYYQRLFAAHDVNPDKLTIEAMTRIPVTTKRDLQEDQAAFIASDATPYMSTRTTGTTGRPAEVWLSQYEMTLWPAIDALSGLLRNEIRKDDCLQINISSRATAAAQLNMSVGRLAKARTRMLGIIPPEESLESLLTGGDAAPTQMNTYPSYLAQIVNIARERGLGPRDFRLRRIVSGGEVLSHALTRAAQETLGATTIADNFGMTEVLPVSGRVCSEDHLHLDINMGYVEIIDLETGAPAAPGALGTVVVTPYYPYRECMPVFRYDTRDVVRCLPDEKLTCEFAAIPATSRILGKANSLLHVAGRVVTMRDLVEVYEALPSHPWPARFSAQVVDDHIAMVVPTEALNGVTKERAERLFREANIDVRIDAIATTTPEQLRPLRADLRETTFAGRK